MYIKVILIFFCLIPALGVYSQTNNYKKIHKTAMEFFDNENYQKALPLLLELDSLKPNSFETKYSIGACYLNSSFEQVKGIPYLEFALKNGEKYLPKVVFRDLGRLYQYDYQFKEAKEFYERYISVTEKTDVELSVIKKYINECEHGIQAINDSIDVEINSLYYPINTEKIETNPLISADEKLLYFTRLTYRKFQGFIIDTTFQIMYSQFQNGKWTNPENVIIPNEYSNKKLSIAGLTPDGQTLFLSIKNAGFDLYYCQIHNDTMNGIKPFSTGINSQFDELSCSITPDGQILYFSSNRPGGYGGRDIYKSLKLENGEWSEAINLGNEVNTNYNEDFPFIHPDNRTLFFSSEGHSTMGEMDIFQSLYVFSSNSWSIPQNLGYPINTTYSDQFFVLSADGNNAYFSSARNNYEGNYDIYRVVLKENIPLTLVKGTITGGLPAKPVKCKIKVYDKESNQKLKYIYNPNPLNGKYLMIFPPNKEYEMVIDAEGYYPYRVNISVPNQTYFYELFQEIHLDKVQMTYNDNELGQEITVKNVFYDLNKQPDSLFRLLDTGLSKRYENLLHIVDNIIENTDSLGQKRLEEYSHNQINDDSIIKPADKRMDELFDLIDKAIETTDSVTLQILDQTTVYQEKAHKIYFYNADGKPNFDFIIVEGDTIYTLPPIETNRKNIIVIDEKDKEPEIKRPKITEKRLIYNHQLFFETADASIKPEYFALLDELIQIMIENPYLLVEITGFADTRGDESENLNLSKDRAFNVLKYFIDNQIAPQRAQIKGVGESLSGKEENDDELQKNRRVELFLYELKIE